LWSIVLQTNNKCTLKLIISFHNSPRNSLDKKPQNSGKNCLLSFDTTCTTQKIMCQIVEPGVFSVVCSKFWLSGIGKQIHKHTDSKVIS
jgi:hypothetical protein